MGNSVRGVQSRQLTTLQCRTAVVPRVLIRASRPGLRAGSASRSRGRSLEEINSALDASVLTPRAAPERIAQSDRSRVIDSQPPLSLKMQRKERRVRKVARIRA